jgi:hypothetical protein
MLSPLPSSRLLFSFLCATPYLGYFVVPRASTNTKLLALRRAVHPSPQFLFTTRVNPSQVRWSLVLFRGLTALIIKSQCYIAIRPPVLGALQKSTALFPTFSSKCDPTSHASCAAEIDTATAVQVTQAVWDATVAMLQVVLLVCVWV